MLGEDDNFVMFPIPGSRCPKGKDRKIPIIKEHSYGGNYHRISRRHGSRGSIS